MSTLTDEAIKQEIERWMALPDKRKDKPQPNHPRLLRGAGYGFLFILAFYGLMALGWLAWRHR